MAINFPLSLPASPGFSRLELIHQAKTGLTESSFNFYEQTQEWAERWEASCTLPPISDRATLGQWEAFLLALRGGAGTFLMGDPKHPSPMGLGPISGELPFLALTLSAGLKTVSTFGWGASRSGVLKRGDLYQLAKNYLTRPIEFDHADWLKTNSGGGSSPTVTANQQANPVTSVVDADQVDFPATGAGQQSILNQAQNAIAATHAGRVLHFYLWLKASASISIDQVIADTGGETTATRNLTTSWQPFTLSRTIATGATTLEVALVQRQNQSAKTVYGWGAILYSLERDARLHKMVNGADVDSGSDGGASLEIWPRTRVANTDWSPIITSNPVGTWRLRPGAWQRSLSEALIAGLGFEAFEAINLA